MPKFELLHHSTEHADLDIDCAIADLFLLALADVLSEGFEVDGTKSGGAKVPFDLLERIFLQSNCGSGNVAVTALKVHVTGLSYGQFCGFCWE